MLETIAPTTLQTMKTMTVIHIAESPSGVIILKCTKTKYIMMASAVESNNIAKTTSDIFVRMLRLSAFSFRVSVLFFFLLMLSLLFNDRHIAEAADSFDIKIRIILEFIAQAVDMYLNGMLIALAVKVPNLVHYLMLRKKVVGI